MPNRLVRDGILESEAVLSLPIEARWLYLSIILSADDIGLFEATPFKLARRATIDRPMVDRLLAMLVDADLVRLYEHNGRPLGFIPRFRQRLQIKRTQHPLPPVALVSDDSDAMSKINDLASRATVAQPCRSVAQRSEPEPEPEKNRREIRPPATLVPPSIAGNATKAKPKVDQPKPLDRQDLIAEGVGAKVAADWLMIRKAKKAPLTQTAWDGIKREAKAAGMSPAEAVQHAVESGWQGFKADWLRRDDRASAASQSPGPSNRFAGVMM